IPIGAAGSFKGIVDVLARKAYTFSDESGKFTEGPVDSSLEAAVTKYRDALIEAAAGTDDALIEKYLNGEELTEAEILLGLRRGVMERKLVPVVPGSGLRNVGVQHLMETFIRYLPSAQDRKISAPLVGKAEDLSIAPNPSDEVCGHVFKVLVEPHVGDLVIVRMYSGTLTTGAQVLNSTREEREKIGTIQRMRGKDRIEAQELGPGQIGTMLKLKSVRWGDTVATEKRPLRFADPLVPEPYMSAALKPTTTQDGEKLPAALARLRTEDPFIKAEMNDVTHEFVVSGTGELHLDNFVRRLRDRYKVNVDVMKPKIPYRETVRGKAEGQGKHKKQSGGHGQYGDCWLRLEPMPTGGGFEFVDAIVGGKIPNRFIPAVEKGVREALVRGILAGYPVTDLRVTVFEGSYHAVDSSEMAFKTAAS
ncbi:MAG: elongation factor G, partial [candidate division NC10 bacterium]|nr:elongation factor G [candidate division NC10 bacterium]